MNELEILNYYQLAFVANAIYCLTFAALIFITFRLIRFQREKNANTLENLNKCKVLVYLCFVLQNASRWLQNCS